MIVTDDLTRLLKLNFSANTDAQWLSGATAACAVRPNRLLRNPTAKSRLYCCAASPEAHLSIPADSFHFRFRQLAGVTLALIRVLDRTACDQRRPRAAPPPPDSCPHIK